MQTVTSEDRIEALALHLDDEDVRDVAKVSSWDKCEIEVHGRSYAVLTDEEADKRAREGVRGLLWACNVSFLRRFIPALENSRAAKAWEKMAGELCEDANPLVEALLGDKVGAAVDTVIREDGRGPTLGAYDGDEEEVRLGSPGAWQYFYIYRQN